MDAIPDTKTLMIELIQTEAKATNLDPKLIYGIVSTESAFDPKAVRYEQAYSYLFNTPVFAKQNRISQDTETVLQKMSWGGMQLMGACAREHGLTGSLFQMLDPQTGIHWGCVHLQKLVKKYPLIEDVIAAYNAGSPRIQWDKYVNQAYVDKVKLAMQNAP